MKNIQYKKNSKNANKNANKKFRLSGCHLFLTYPKLCFEKTEVLSQLQLKFQENPILKYVICSEQHNDGMPHVHVYIKLLRRCNIRDIDRLDLFFEGKRFHGNYQTCRSYDRVLRYVSKNNDLLTNMDLDCNGREFNVWRSILNEAKAGDLDSVLETITDVSPRLVATDFRKVRGSLEAIRDFYKRSRSKVYPLSSFDISKVPELLDYAENKTHDKTLYLSGPTGTNKTEFIKSLFTEKVASGKPEDVLRITDKEGISKLSRGNHKAIILDDFNPKDYTSEELLHLTDLKNDSDHRVLYNNVRLDAHVARALISNHKFEDLFKDLPVAHIEALLRRCLNVNLKGKKVIIRVELEVKEDN